MILLLTAGIMGITLFVLAKAAKHFGLPIKGKALALAGVLACAIACVLPFIAPFLTEGYYIKLGVLAVAAALLVTGYNAYLWKKDDKAAESADETTEGEATDAQTAEETLAARTRAAIGTQHFKWEPPDEPEEAAAEPEPEPKPEPVEEPKEARKKEEPDLQAEPPAEPVKKQEVPSAGATKKAPAEIKEAKPEKPPEKKEESPKKEEPILQAEPPSQRGEGRLRQGESPVQQDQKQDASSAGATEKAEPIKEKAPVEKPEPVAPPKLLPAPKPEPAPAPNPEPKPIEKPKPKPEPEPAPDFSTFTTLDDYLDYADAAQKKGDLENATTAYANAVDIYVSDPYIIYLYMDLGNLLKQQARYADCINVYHAALSIPILAENPAIAREFEKNIRYLEVVQAVLKRHHAEDTPFGDIPEDIRAEIETTDQALEKKSASKDETS